MPEGPSIVLLKEAAISFSGKEILSVEGNSKIDMHRFPGKRVESIQSWGKQFLIVCDDFIIRIHFLLFGSYRINERKEQPPRLSLQFENGELNFYACSVKILEGRPEDLFDPEGDVMNDQWNPEKAKSKLEQTPNAEICDALLEQDIFAGVGNIIKNEVLYRVQVHPESLVGKIPPAKLDEIIYEARNYSFQFLEWKRNFELKKHWLCHNQKTCRRCELPFSRKHTGTKNRRSFICVKCQELYV
ncbi:MAG: Formamidopyrimidine-DNA glycolase [Crocinitomicaceae bacterium]|jgi:endonuclease-8|nr:Formamidopyrimidine-DNA glycolase [Crocinitomicaceae bacterium]